ncbi:response regulator transcription factor [Beijerinckia sp. L45]|uniref:response regulator transcription factor n=1 Tax=Beijerinckia sp. L45 TaxID=1641855 RepID=UPI001AEE5CBF|nr:response regulator transcription factor [Beijerinckia sp. L45]
MKDTSEQTSIFLFEDDAGLASEIILAFAREGLTVLLLATEDELVTVAGPGKSCVLIMDRMVDNVDSLAILERLRASGNRTPVIVISSLASVDERIKGLKGGGDDYLIKPFAMGELIARVESLRRRTPDDRRTTLSVGTLSMDIIGRTVVRGKRSIPMPPREFSLLEFLMRRPDQVVTRTMILEDVWKYKGTIDTNIVDVHMGNLRRKIDGEGEVPMIKSQRGIGFILTSDDR